MFVSKLAVIQKELDVKVKNNLIFFCAVNSQRLLFSQKAGMKCLYLNLIPESFNTIYFNDRFGAASVSKSYY